VRRNDSKSKVIAEDVEWLLVAQDLDNNKMAFNS